MRTGADLNRLLPALAVYMGHANLCTTQKYLAMTPERFRKQLNKLSPIRRKGHWRDDKELMAFLSDLSSEHHSGTSQALRPAGEVIRFQTALR